MGNIFDKRGIVPPGSMQEQGREVFDTLLSVVATTGQRVRLERIMSFGEEHGEWYDQGWDEWVMVVRGDGSVTELEAGGYLLIEAHRRHRVLRTSFDCVWLALHLGGEEK